MKFSFIIIGLLCLVIIGVFFSSCKTKKNTTVSPYPEVKFPTRSAPNTCLVISRILEIFPENDDNPELEKCSKGPCNAKIEITKVLSRGVGTDGAFRPGEVLIAHFPYTLLPANELFPELTSYYPGLDKGDKFKATIRMNLRVGKSDPSYSIYKYLKQ